MGSQASEVDICNMALTYVGAQTITSLDDEQERARLCKLHYPRVRDTVLGDREWTFAVKRFTLSPDVTPPLFNWGNRFLIPSEVLRVLSAERESIISSDTLTSNLVEHEQINWVREGQYILADEDVVYVRALVRIESTAEFTEGFVHALAARLAADLAMPIVRSRSMADQMYALYTAKLRDAAVEDGLQGRSKRIRSRYLSSRR